MLSLEKFDIVGIGVGPANLALIAALLDARDVGQQIPRAVFLERDARFGWHPGALLPGSRVQVPFTKDLATQRNPRSRYTFLNYLHEQGRIEDFINLREMFPEREEFSQYMAWIASEAGDLVRFASEVSELFPVIDAAGRVARIGVTCITGLTSKNFSARCIVLGTGCRPHVPTGVRADQDRIVHTAHLLECADSELWRAMLSPRFLVVGAGESGIEAACYLLREFPSAEVEICLRRLTPQSIDDNPFVNQWYGSRSAEAFDSMDETTRTAVLADLAGSSLGVAEHVALEELYRHHYRGLRNGHSRVLLRSGHSLLRAEASYDGVDCLLTNVVTGETLNQRYSALVLATGYEDTDPTLLRPLNEWLQFDDDGACCAGPDYRLRTRGLIDAMVFLHGVREKRHGPAERSLSTRAVRAGVLFKVLRTVLGYSK